MKLAKETNGRTMSVSMLTVEEFIVSGTVNPDRTITDADGNDFG